MCFLTYPERYFVKVCRVPCILPVYLSLLSLSPSLWFDMWVFWCTNPILIRIVFIILMAQILYYSNHAFILAPVTFYWALLVLNRCFFGAYGNMQHWFATTVDPFLNLIKMMTSLSLIYLTWAEMKIKFHLRSRKWDDLTWAPLEYQRFD